MKTTPEHLATSSFRQAFLSFFLLAVASRISAQNVISPEPELISAALEQAGIPQKQDELGIGASEGLPESPFKYGAYTLKPHFLYRVLYGDGIQSSPGHPLITTIDTLSPGFLLAYANAWTLDYTPSWDLYSNHAFHDTLDQSVNFLIKNNFVDWSLQFVQSYSDTSDPMIETGGQTDHQEYSTALDVSRRINDRALVDFNLSQVLQYSVGFTDSFEWSNQDWLHYRFSPHFDTAIGSGFGYVAVSQGLNSSYGRPEVQASWVPTEKVSVSITVGLEHREYYGLSSPSLNTPIYNASFYYTPASSTKLILTADRQVSPSFFENQSTRGTQWNATIEQRLLKHFQLSAGVGIDTVSYLAANNSLSAVRRDDVQTYNLRLSTTLLRRGTIAILYQLSKDSSTTPGFGYSSGQIGMELSYRY